MTKYFSSWLEEEEKNIYDKKHDENIIIILWRGNSFDILI